MMRAVAGPGARMGTLLAAIEQQQQKSCDSDVGGCNRLYGVTHVLEAAPQVFTLQLAWESQQEAGADVAATLAAVDEVVDLAALYQGLPPGAHRYRLRSMVAYYGAHYQAFVRVGEEGGGGGPAAHARSSWVLFDDAHVAAVGPWPDLLRRCEAGRIQPSVLFYLQV